VVEHMEALILVRMLLVEQVVVVEVDGNLVAVAQQQQEQQILEVEEAPAVMVPMPTVTERQVVPVSSSSLTPRHKYLKNHNGF
jgi:hypothetical protein